MFIIYTNGLKNWWCIKMDWQFTVKIHGAAAKFWGAKREDAAGNGGISQALLRLRFAHNLDGDCSFAWVNVGFNKKQRLPGPKFGFAIDHGQGSVRWKQH